MACMYTLVINKDLIKNKYSTEPAVLIKMENSALNLAHQQSRRAEAHLRAKRFEEAVECHKKAANLLSEAMGSTQQPRALESLNLQQQHHLRQTDIIKLKKSQYEKYMRAMEKTKSSTEAGSALMVNSSDTIDSNLHVAIFRTMEEADSLMDQLLQRNEDDDCVDTPTPSPPVVKGSKQPKDDKMVVEELRTLTQHLHDLVIQLVTQLDAKNEENEALRAQIKILTSQLESSTSSPNAVASLSLPTDSPYVFSPCTELSPDATPTASQPASFKSVDRTLPILAPLEMPCFDFSVFQKVESSKTSPDLSQ